MKRWYQNYRTKTRKPATTCRLGRQPNGGYQSLLDKASLYGDLTGRKPLARKRRRANCSGPVYTLTRDEIAEIYGQQAVA